MCCGLRHYVPYQYTKGHAEGICASFKHPDKSICCRIAAVAYHALATLICTLVDTLLSACRVVYVAIAPGNSGSKTSIDPAPNPGGTAPVEPPPGPAPLKPPPQPAPAPGSSAPETQPVRDPGLDAPTWRISESGEYSLDQLAPFRFHKARMDDFVTVGDKLKEKNNAFSFSRTTIPLFDGDCFAIKIECPALEILKKSSEDLRAWLSEVSLHCGEAADINLPEPLRADFAMHPGAKQYRFIYPIQPDPDPEKARRLIAALAASPVPDFIKNLMLIGGYVYYRENENGTKTTLLQVKPFSANSQATEILATGRALNARDFLPEKLLDRFTSGVQRTHENFLCSSVNKITAPSLVEHLTHFGYVPQSLYKGSKAEKAAPYGAFLYRTKTGKLQLVPIGGDFVEAFKPLDRTAKSDEQMQQIYKQHTFASVFYPSGGDNPSVTDIRGLLAGVTITYQTDSVQLIIREDDGTRYVVQAFNGRTILIRKLKNGDIDDSNAHIDSQGQVSGSGAERFTELLNEVYPHLMKKMLRVAPETGRIYTVKESIDFAPIEHLAALINIINQDGNLSVNYFDLFLHAYIAIDAGGVRRDYISKLFIALLRHSNLFEERDGFYKLKADIDVSKEENRAVLQNIGTFLAWVLNQRGAFPLGRSFSPQFFTCLSACFGDRTDKKLLELFLAYTPEVTKGVAYKPVIDCLDLEQPPTKGSDLQVKGLIPCLLTFLIGDLDVQYKVDDLGNSQPESPEALERANTKIRQNWNTIRLEAKQAIIEQAQEFLTPYQIVADSLRSNLAGVILPRTEAEFDKRIQGETDLEVVKAAIVYNGPRQGAPGLAAVDRSIHNKAGWIRGWLTEQNVGRFLLAATGSPALGPDQRIWLNSMSVDAEGAKDFWPVYHACSKSIDMPHGTVLDGQGGAHKNEASFLQSFEKGLDYALAANGFTQG